MRKLLLAVSTIIFLNGCSADSKAPEAEKEVQEVEVPQEVTQNVSLNSEEPLTTKSEPIDYSNVAYEITKNGYPKTYDKWGKDWIEDINKMMPLAVNIVASNPKCDKPEIADLSDNRSTPKKEAVFYVDCQNGERFYISQSELNSGNEVKAESDKLSGQPHEFIAACRESVKKQLQFPSSFNEELLSTTSNKKMSGNVEVIMPFTAKNSLGLELPQVARCLITTQNKIEVSISDR